MMPSGIDGGEEDEDVVIAGSELHEALSKMGYSDYEIVPITNESPSNDKPIPKRKSDGWAFEIFLNKMTRAYRHVVKDSDALRKELVVISEAQHLLDDHADLITSLSKEDQAGKFDAMSGLLNWLKNAGAVAVGWYFVDRSNPVTWLVTLPALNSARLKYSKWRTVRNLKKLIAEQTELCYNYKRALRILNHSFRMKPGSKFADLGAEKLKLLPPMLERTMKSMEIMSISYYKTTLRMAKMLPEENRKDLDSQITYFDEEHFVNCGEVTYSRLKQLCYKFILIQSEMLLTLAVLRHNDPSDIFRGMRIDHVVEKLVELTTEHRMSMSKTVDSFQNYKLAAVKDKHRSFPGSKWQDLYVRLHLTSRKMEKSYETIASTLEDIENHLDRGIDEPELVGRLKTRLNEVCSDVDKIKDLAQLSALIIYKMEQDLGGDRAAEKKGNGDNGPCESSQREIPVIRDSEPEINDEVFEEYIRERYSEALNNQGGDDGYLDMSIKLDKLLSKNLMSELKEALVDKQKDMKERESRALKRMNRSPVEEVVHENLENCEIVESNDSRQGFGRESERSERSELEVIPRPPPLPMPRRLNQFKEGSGKLKEEEDEPASFFVPLITSDSIKLPLFVSIDEETFIGSGENSEAELAIEEDEDEDEDEDEEKLP